MPLLHVNGTDVHLTDTGAPAGRPEAPTVVFGHGLLFSGRMFDDQVAALGERYRCITIDWRGQGRTPPATTGGYDMDTLLGDVVGLLDELGLDAVHYVGLSMGGFVGMRLAARHPDRVLSLSLLDTSAGPEDPEKVKRYRLLARVYRLFGMGIVRGQVEPIMFGPTALGDPAVRPRIDRWLEDLATVDRSGMRQAILGVTDRLPVAPELGSITAPTLVVVGADDVATPVHKSEAIVAGIAGARLEVVPDCGHSSTIEQPTILSRLLADFIG
ncbi:hydrolase, alpha/beta domain protein [Aeromicrobium marinum DSM 15272]|uniref:Hydrolase, alpha/beta domain protein n=1 Tax=Aeromicrobium marinum DSM 15272 TaxID=585531 RepID=E2SBY7_9ACTN|nr:alpha/beta fold hydrolase [Aeromicrobium marinum]EFQ83273.1 hydrolase, alpha/beta domain protein [Aeromicrobium marinum DSM 15272]